eukprot:COSAG05_NODE_40_length_27088_cov_92.858276_8_plen_205_part_00
MLEKEEAQRLTLVRTVLSTREPTPVVSGAESETASSPPPPPPPPPPPGPPPPGHTVGFNRVLSTAFAAASAYKEDSIATAGERATALLSRRHVVSHAVSAYIRANRPSNTATRTPTTGTATATRMGQVSAAAEWRETLGELFARVESSSAAGLEVGAGQFVCTAAAVDAPEFISQVSFDSLSLRRLFSDFSLIQHIMRVFEISS